MSIPVPILDTHIHLYPLSEAPTLAWNHPGHPLWGQRSLAEYTSATASSHDLLSGFIFLETDRATDEADPTPTGGWQHPLAEVSFLARVAAGQPRAGEGHEARDASLCQGIVPWAPVPAGAAVLERYLQSVEEVCGRDGDGAATWAKVKGFRYLLQDKPEGVMLQEGFVEGVRLLGRRGFVFDVGVDLHRRGRGQLEEVVELVERAHRGVADAEKTVFILSELISCQEREERSEVVNRGGRGWKGEVLDGWLIFVLGQTTSANQTSRPSTPVTQASSPGALPCSPYLKPTTSTCKPALHPPRWPAPLSSLTPIDPQETLRMPLRDDPHPRECPAQRDLRRHRALAGRHRGGLRARTHHVRQRLARVHRGRRRRCVG